MTLTFGCVVLSQGTRPVELRRALDSLLSQRGAEIDVVVVGNGWVPTGQPAGVKTVALPRNDGIPAGRNAGVPHVRGQVLVFIDDDAWLSGPDVLSTMGALLSSEPSIGLIQPRFSDPDGRPTPRQWVPRLRVGDPARSSDVCAVFEAVVVVPRSVFDAVGGWAGSFFYAHEGIDLAWRVLDAGLRVRYLGDVVVHHRAGVSPQRHPYFYRFTSRNRVLLARRNLPVPVGVLYVTTWVVLTLVRAPGTSDRLRALQGFVEGFRAPSGPRRPMRWATVWRMTLLGRPPVI